MTQLRSKCNAGGGGGNRRQLSLVLLDEAILLRTNVVPRARMPVVNGSVVAVVFPKAVSNVMAGVWSWNGANSRLERQNFVNFGAALASVAGCVGQATRMPIATQFEEDKTPTGDVLKNLGIILRYNGRPYCGKLFFLSLFPTIFGLNSNLCAGWRSHPRTRSTSTRPGRRRNNTRQTRESLGYS